MTNLETALSIGTGEETTIEELEKVLVSNDVGLNVTDGLEEVDLEVLFGEYESLRLIAEYGESAKYFV